VFQAVATDGHRHHLAARRIERLLHELIGGVLARSDEQAIANFECADAEKVHGRDSSRGSTRMNTSRLNTDPVGRIRSSIRVFAPLRHRRGVVHYPPPTNVTISTSSFAFSG